MRVSGQSIADQITKNATVHPAGMSSVAGVDQLLAKSAVGTPRSSALSSRPAAAFSFLRAPR